MIYLMRHGRIEQSEPRRFVGQRDVPLDDTGREQARAMHCLLAAHGFARVICSDLKRSVETAELVSRGRNLDILKEPNLRELNLGKWQGLTTDEVKERYAQEYEARGLYLATTRPSGGESFRDLRRRVMPCFERIMETDRGGTLVVAHSAVNRTILCSLLGLDLELVTRLGQDYCCLNVIRPAPGGAVLEAMNVTAPAGY